MSRTDGGAVDAGQAESARLTLGEMGPVGDTLATFEGREIHVFGGIPGEEVEAEIVRYRRRRRRTVAGVVTRVLRPSPHRIAPPCPLFGPCTGCQWQHIDYAHQLDLKRRSVADELRRYDSLQSVDVSPTLPSPSMFNYRNHARMMVRRQGKLGFVNRTTLRFVAVDNCKIMEPWINEAIAALQGNSQETTQLSIRYGVGTGDWLIQPTMHSPGIPIASGQAHYRERLLDRTFRVSSPSFFQVNTRQAERMVEIVRSRLRLTGGEVLVDAFAGVGTFAVLLAPYARRTIAIEESAAAVRDATVNGQEIDGLELVSPAWIEASTTPRTVSRYSRRQYGYGWWIRTLAGYRTYYAWGYGGQFIFVIPALDSVVVATSAPEPGEGRRRHRRELDTLIDCLVVPAVERAVRVPARRAVSARPAVSARTAAAR